MHKLPAESVDVPGGEMRDVNRARDHARLIFLASFVFAGLAWVGTLITAITSSETNGIFASWIAMFPTTFGAAGLLALKAASPAGRALLIAFASGIGGSIGLWLFFEGIWPSL